MFKRYENYMQILMRRLVLIYTFSYKQVLYRHGVERVKPSNIGVCVFAMICLTENDVKRDVFDV